MMHGHNIFLTEHLFSRYFTLKFGPNIGFVYKFLLDFSTGYLYFSKSYPCC